LKTIYPAYIQGVKATTYENSRELEKLLSRLLFNTGLIYYQNVLMQGIYRLHGRGYDNMSSYICSFADYLFRAGFNASEWRLTDKADNQTFEFTNTDDNSTFWLTAVNKKGIKVYPCFYEDGWYIAGSVEGAIRKEVEAGSGGSIDGLSYIPRPGLNSGLNRATHDENKMLSATDISKLLRLNLSRLRFA